MTEPDIFDVFNEFPHVMAVPIEEAVQAFRQFHKDRMTHYAELCASPEYFADASMRKSEREKWDRVRQETELLLFRSIVA